MGKPTDPVVPGNSDNVTTPAHGQPETKKLQYDI